MSFRLKIILGVAAIEAVLLAILVLGSYGYSRATSTAELARRAATTASLFASMSAEPVLASDLATLQSFGREVLKNPGLVYARVRDRQGRVLVEEGAAEALARPFAAGTTTGDVLDAAVDIIIGGKTFGRVEIGLSTTAIREALGKELRWMGGIALTEMVLVALFSFALGLYLTRQLDNLREGARRMAAGEFGIQIAVHGRDELAQTAAAFNRMTVDLERMHREWTTAQEELVRAYDLVEERVRERTDELSQANARLEQEIERRAEAEAVLQRNLETQRLVAAVLHDSLEPTPIEATLEKALAAVVASPDFGFAAPAMVFTVDEVRRELVPRARFGTVEPAPVRSPLGRCPCGRPAGEAVARHAADGGLGPHYCAPIRSGGNVLGLLVLALRPGRRAGADDEGFVGLVADVLAGIIQRHAKERQVEHLQRLESMGSLAGGIAHEINNLLQPIVFLSEMVMESLPEDSPNRDHLRKIMKSSDRIGELVRRILTFSRSEKRPGATARLLPAVEEAVGMLRAALPSTIAVEARLAPFADRVTVSPTDVHTVLINLGVNARDAMSEDKGTLWIELAEAGADEVAARIDLEAGRRHARLSVRDDGCGMDEATAARIFDPFFTTKEVGRGTGLGLSVVHGIVTRHGGAIDVRSAPGRGTAFTILLPLEED
jgi:signal transduction histidine kinase